MSCSKSSNKYDNNIETDSIDSNLFFSDDEGSEAHSLPYEVQALEYILNDDYEQGIILLNKALEVDPKKAFVLEYRGMLHHMLKNNDQALADLDKALEIDPVSASALVYRGEVHYDLENYELALADLDKALEIEPKNVSALGCRGAVQYDLGNHDQALADLDKALEIDPVNASALLYRGEVHFDLENYELALADLDKVLEIDPENVTALRYRGVIHYMLDNLNQALADFNEILDINPSSELALKYRGAVHYILGNYDQALLDLNKALDINPSSAFTLTYRGAVYYSLNNYDQALEDLDMAQKIDPENTFRTACRGTVNLNNCNKYQKLCTYSKMLNIDPKNVPALICRGNVYQMLGNNDRALIDINRALEIDQDNVTALGIRSIVYRNLKNYKQALIDINKALEIDPENASSLEHRGRAYQLLGNYDDALRDLNRSIEIEPECQFALGYRGELHRMLGNYNDSLSDLDKSLKIEPDNVFALTNRGVVYQQLGYYDKAMSDLNEALRVDPEETLALTTRGIVHKQLKNYNQALADLNIALKTDHESAIIFAVRGEIYKLLNNYDQAKADLDRALEIDPANISALATRASINRILHNYELELADLNKTLEIDQQNKPALAIRGDIYTTKLVNYDLALADFDKALNIDSEDNNLDEFIIARRGIVFSHLKDYEKALIDLNRVFKTNPGIGIQFGLRDNDDDNDELYQTMLREALVDLNNANPADPSALTLRGHIWRMLGEYEKALNEIKRALCFNQNYSYALEIRDELCELRKKHGVHATDSEVFRLINAAFEASADSHRSLNVCSTGFKPCSECAQSENSFEYCKSCLDRTNLLNLEKMLKYMLATSSKVGESFSCSQCKGIITSPNWCSICDYDRLKSDFSNWTSDNQQIDELIKELQSYVEDYQGDVIEWIPYTRFVNIKQIGEGSFSKVFKADWLDGKIKKWNYNTNQWERVGKTCVALKMIENSKDEVSEFLNEAKGYVECRNTIAERSIIRIYGFSRDPSTKDYIIVMQYLEGGNLHSFLSKRKGLDLKKKLSILSNIAYGLVTMHHFISLVHGDFHPGNILFDKNDNVFITDLGLCRHASQNFKPKQGFVHEYTAPEILHGGRNTMASDIYSFGMIMFEVVMGKAPFTDYDYNLDELSMSICQGNRPKVPNNIPIAFTLLMKKCWDNDPKKRPCAFAIEDWLEDTQKAIELYSMSLNERAKYESEHKGEIFKLKGFEEISDYIAENFLTCNENPVIINSTSPPPPTPKPPKRIFTIKIPKS